MVMLDFNHRQEQEAKRNRNAVRYRKALVAYRIERMRRYMRLGERVVWLATGAIAAAMSMLLWQCVAGA